MRILLVGEYSGLHNSLKEGLVALGHRVVIVGNRDGFKKYPVDYNIDARFCKTKLVNIPRQLIFRVFKYDIAKLETGIRFYLFLKKLKGFDVVQLINEAPIKTSTAFELFLLKKLFKQNPRFFLLSCGVDYNNINFHLRKELKYSLLTPYLDNPAYKKEYRYILEYLKKDHQQLHEFVYRECVAIIASDIDYVLPLQGHPKFYGMIPNPVNLEMLEFTLPEVDSEIVIFLGINRGNYIQKGIVYFEKALAIIQKKYPGKAKIVVVENLPYREYISSYNQAHIILDQVFAYDQGYNALEAMAKGKVVFTGAEKEFMDYYGLTERVNINALPDVAQLVKELSILIENPQEIITIAKRARAFIEREHEAGKIASKYLEAWSGNTKAGYKAEGG